MPGGWGLDSSLHQTSSEKLSSQIRETGQLKWARWEECGGVNQKHKGWKKKKPFGQRQPLMWSNGMDNAKWKTQMTSKAENFTVLGQEVNQFFPNLLLIVQIDVRLEMGVQKQAGYLLCKQMVFDFFFKSLISLTPFPKIVHSFAYLQCANSAVWNSTLCRVYRQAPFSFAADGTESVSAWK